MENITIECNEDKKEYLRIAKESYNTAKKFFNAKEDIKIKIKFLYKREEMDKINGTKTPYWFVARVKTNKIYIFSPEVIEQVSKDPTGKSFGHKKTDIPKILTHEITHQFLYQYLGRTLYPKWINEGIAQFVAKQYYDKKYLINRGFTNFEEIHSEKQWDKNPDYWQAHAFIDYLVTKYGKEILLDFIKKLNEKLSYREFTKVFEGLYNITFEKVEKEYQGWLKND